MLGGLTALAHPAAATTDIPLLSTGPTSLSYEISLIDEPFMANITFARQGRFFMVGAALTNDVTKFDANGQEVFRLKFSRDNFRPAFSHYIATNRGIYDFSQARPRLLRFEKIYNGWENRSYSSEVFIKYFAQFYAAADVVVYGDYNSDIGKIAIFLRTGGKWTIFYASPVRTDIDRDRDLGNSIAGFPAKFAKMDLLKDPVSKRYSYSDYRLRDREIRLPEDRLRYSRSAKLKRLSYSEDFVLEEVPYTPIPGSFAGVATYRLTVGGEAIEFKEIATRGALRVRAQSNLSLFQLPKPYDQQVPVLFLEFRPLSNFETLGSDGLYIIRPKR